MLVYVGGVVVLIVFGVMVTTRGDNGVLDTTLRSPFPGILLGLITLALRGSVFIEPLNNGDQVPEDVAISGIGIELMTSYLLAFEMIAVLLLMAIIGAAVIARTKVNSNNG